MELFNKEWKFNYLIIDFDGEFYNAELCYNIEVKYLKARSIFELRSLIVKEVNDWDDSIVYHGVGNKVYWEHLRNVRNEIFLIDFSSMEVDNVYFMKI